MVWGMALPGNFGEFFPDGDFVGWDEELAKYFDNEMPAERKALFESPRLSSYIYYAAENFVNEPGLKRPGLPPFGPIAAHEAPRRFAAEKKYAALGSFVKLTGRILAVDGRLKELIENCEPGVHHFFPIEIVMPKLIVYPNRYFIMAIGQFIDSFSPEQSEPTAWRRDGDAHFFFDESTKLMPKLALSLKTFGDAHLWRERRMSNELICFSDTLIAEINKSGLRLPMHCKLREI